MNQDVKTFMDDTAFSRLDVDQKIENIKTVQKWLDQRTNIWDQIFALQTQGKNDQADLLLALL